MRRVLIGLAAAASLGLSAPANAAAAPPVFFEARCETDMGPFAFFVLDPRNAARFCRETFGGQFRGMRPIRLGPV
jgi:hypothetical protein